MVAVNTAMSDFYKDLSEMAKSCYGSYDLIGFLRDKSVWIRSRMTILSEEDLEECYRINSSQLDTAISEWNSYMKNITDAYVIPDPPVIDVLKALKSIIGDALKECRARKAWSEFNIVWSPTWGK
jgi:hypothetical protein